MYEYVLSFLGLLSRPFCICISLYNPRVSPHLRQSDSLHNHKRGGQIEVRYPSRSGSGRMSSLTFDKDMDVVRQPSNIPSLRSFTSALCRGIRPD